MPNSQLVHTVNCSVDDFEPQQFVGSSFADCVSKIFSVLAEGDGLENEITSTLEALLEISHHEDFDDDSPATIEGTSSLDMVTWLKITYARTAAIAKATGEA